MATPVALPPQFGRYRIVQSLGAGGMGAVYLAEDTVLSRKVAIKVPHFTADDGPLVRERFLREARAAAAIDHPNLCPIYDTGECQGLQFLVMPFIEGNPLSRLVDEEHCWPPEQALTLVRKLALALQVLHERGMIHRDLKPSNVMIRANGEPVIMDFGLAKSLTNQSRQLTKLGAMVGTPAYMPPEQVLGELKSMGPPADVYSLGVILYELLTGQLPFEGPPTVVFAQILHAAPEAPSARRPGGLGSWLDAVCLQALTKKPEERYATMTAFALALTPPAPLAATLYTSSPQPHPMNAPPQAQATEEMPPRKGAALSVASITCPKCGKQLKVPPGAGNKRLFCPRCQTNLTQLRAALRETPALAESPDITVPDRPAAKPRVGNWLAVVMTLLISLPLGWLLFGPKKDSDNPTSSNGTDKPKPKPDDKFKIQDDDSSFKDLVSKPDDKSKIKEDDSIFKKPVLKPADDPGPKPYPKTEPKPRDKPSDKEPPTPDDKPDDKKPSDKKPDDPMAKAPFPASRAFLRRALVISLHNYLFANPLTAGDPTPSGRNIQNFIGRLSQTKGFRISPNQVAFLSDAVLPPRFQTYAPIKATIEGTITEYLQTARAQDRVLLVFAGHGAEIDGKVYLAPIEGSLTQASTMIPLEWVYKQMSDCKAQQKVLILDVCRTNRARGEERASFGAMTPKFDLALKNPPEGVQVWASCTAGQQSYEFEDFRINNSVFLDSLYQVADRGIDGVIQKPDDPIPLEKFVEKVNDLMRKGLEPHRLTQTSRLSGTMGRQLPFDGNDKLAVEPTVIAAARKTSAAGALVRGILKELDVPPVKKQQNEGLLRYEAMPPFSADVLDKYPIDNTPHALREAVERAQALLWAISPNEPPPELAVAVRKLRDSDELKGISNLNEFYLAPADRSAENQFRTMLFDDGRRAASILRLLEEELANLTKAGEMKNDAPMRWQLNYEFMLARLQKQLAYTFEYSSMLGAMRKEFPPRDATVHSGWRLASKKKLEGDSEGRKKLKDAEKLLDKLIADHAGTPWEILARREKMTTLGLEWKAN